MPPTMTGSCSREGCQNKISSQNKSGVCTPCQQGYPVGGKRSKLAARTPARASTSRDADDDALDSEGLDEPAADEAPPETEEAPPESADLRDFFTLAEALGLDAQKMLDGWCRQWVEKVRTRALGGKPSGDAPAELQETPAGE